MTGKLSLFSSSAKLLGASVLAACICPTGVNAQAAPGGPEQAAPAALGEVIVTATRRETSIQSTPLSIAAVTADTIQKLGATNLQDYFRQVPALNLTPGIGGSNRLTIRGVQSTGEATVGLYFDETAITGPTGTAQDAGNGSADLNLFDVNRVEVLRGPQGTLYGSGSVGGTLRLIFNKPNLARYEGAAEVQGDAIDGGGSGGFAKAMANVPLIADKLGLRVVGYYEDKPGYVDSVYLKKKDVNSTTSRGARAYLTYEPTSSIKLAGSFIYQKQQSDDFQGWYPSVGTYKTNSPLRLPFKSDLKLYNITGSWDVGFATLTGSSSYYDYDILRSGDFTTAVQLLSRSPAGCASFYSLTGACSSSQLSAYTAYGLSRTPVISYQPASLDVRANEARLSSKGSGPLVWTIGAYSENRSDHIDSNVASGNPADGNVYLPLRNLSYRYVKTYVRQVAEFGELSYSPVKPITLTFGARHYNYVKSTSGQVLLATPLTGTSLGPFSQIFANADGWVTKYNLSYRPNNRIMAYAQAANGFRPGGANNIPSLSAGLLAYAPDKVWTYEAGLKTSWLSGRLTVNATLFQTDWTNMQIQAVTANGLFGFNANAGAARIRGGELEANIYPSGGLTINFGLGYQNGRLTQDQTNSNVLATGSTGLKGDRIPNVPDLTVSSSVNYTWALTDSFSGLLRADFAYTGESVDAFRETYVYFDRFGNYSTVNLRAGVEGEGWGVYAFLTNATGTRGAAAVVSNLGFKRLTYSIQPRTVGINIKKSF